MQQQQQQYTVPHTPPGPRLLVDHTKNNRTTFRLSNVHKVRPSCVAGGCIAAGSDTSLPWHLCMCLFVMMIITRSACAPSPPLLHTLMMAHSTRFIIRCCACLRRRPRPPHHIPQPRKPSRLNPTGSPLLPHPPPSRSSAAVPVDPGLPQQNCLRGSQSGYCGAYLSQTRCFELFNGRFRLCGLAGRCHGPSPLYSEWPRLVHVPLRRYVPYLSFRTVTFCDIPSGTTAISRTASCTARCDSLCSYYNHISVRLQCIQVTNIASHRAGWCGPMASFTKAC
jgi:hypothetical protein